MAVVRFLLWFGKGLLGGWSPLPSTLLVMTFVALAQGAGLWFIIAKVSTELLRYSHVGFVIPSLLVALVLLINLQDGPESGSHLRRLTGVLLSAVVLLDYFSIFLAIGDHPKVGVTVLSKAASLPILWGLVSLRLSRYETGVLAAMARRTLDVLRFVMGLAVFALFSWAVDLKASGQEPLARMIAVFYGPLVSTVQTLIGLKPWSGATKDGTGTALLLCAFGYAGLGWMNLEMVDVWWASGLFGMIASHVGSVATLYYTGRRA